MADRMLQDSEWHLDKRVPIALLVAILVQTGAAFWWASDISERVTALERGAMAAAPQADRLTRVEVKIDALRDNLNDLKSALLARPRISTTPQQGQ